MPYLSINHPITEKVKNKNANKQIIKVLTEHWTANNIFCPVCWSALDKHKIDKPINDLFCIDCKNDFELKSEKLKSKKWNFWKMLTWGSYKKAIEAIETKPMHLFVLKYSDDFTITNFLVVPKYFFTKNVIIKRPKALKGRSNYFMSDIDFSAIPESWKIHYINNWTYKTRTEILEEWNKVKFLEEIKDKKGTEKWEAKWWLLDIMLCIEKLDKKIFHLKELDIFLEELQLKHPKNNYIKDKIRQKIQVLRDKWYLEFVDWKGNYKIL